MNSSKLPEPTSDFNPVTPQSSTTPTTLAANDTKETSLVEPAKDFSYSTRKDVLNKTIIRALKRFLSAKVGTLKS